MWTEDRIAKCLELWNGGLSGTQIASRLGGVTRNAVLGLVHRKGLMGHRNQGSEQAVVNRIRHASNARKAEKSRLRAETLDERRGAIKARTESPIKNLLRNLPTEPLPAIDDLSPTLSWAKLEDTTNTISQCRAILPAVGNKTICGRKTVPGTSWCECHLRRYANAIVPKQNNFREASPAMKEGARSSGKPHRVFA